MAMSESGRRARSEARRSRITLRKSSLRALEHDLSPVRGADAVSLVATLTREAWALAGRDEPRYTRDATPYRFVPRPRT